MRLNVMEFKKGDIVKLIDNTDLRAPRYSLAEVTQNTVISDDFVQIRWKDFTSNLLENDGGFYKRRFEIVNESKSFLDL